MLVVRRKANMVKASLLPWSVACGELVVEGEGEDDERRKGDLKVQSDVPQPPARASLSQS